MIFFILNFSIFSQIQKSEFKEIKIGEQTWMLENLNVTNFRNGDQIPEASTEEEWINAGKEGKPAWCNYKNMPEMGAKFGKLYNWFAVNDPRGIAPAGWHIPTDKEWSQTTLFLGGEDAAGTKMKSSTGWNGEGDGTTESLKAAIPIQEKAGIDGFGNGTNVSGFTALSAGSRDRFGKFDYLGKVTYFWCKTSYDADFAWYRAIDQTPWYVYRTHYYKQNGYSVRCLKD